VILLVAIIGAITLTLRQRKGVLRQDIGLQVGRDRAATVELRKVKVGSGIQ
jgi:NADH-quinone oxidoreductase subunit J